MCIHFYLLRTVCVEFGNTLLFQKRTHPGCSPVTIGKEDILQKVQTLQDGQFADTGESSYFIHRRNDQLDDSLIPSID
ncbi:hypothetical protein E2C01_053868 [Portunus trituberculatus]|uniref:Uncharacterized protein n=1 Tax=Portunus trituberculatus TaxID=210409 RepID=A0A5B7GHT8_PORTR|nr:hypothetical protein [Portunus trituberculatus]